MKQRFLVAMSGGVDSSVAAALLLEQGYDVVGVFMKFWQPGRLGSRQCDPGENVCCSYESHQEAKKVARQLGIKLYTLNFTEPFKQAVVDDFIKQYRLGATPNPCIICNEKIKFGLLHQKAESLGIKLVASGHYARTKKEAGHFSLYKGLDKRKDQSYFLYRLSQADLARTLFPLGEMTKSEVRELAEEFDLPVASRQESQEVCFVPDGDVLGFLNHFIKDAMNPGNIVTTDGEVVGKHKGLPIYTIGQRRGIEIGGIGPFYVVGKNLDKNELIVTKDEAELLSNELMVTDVKWVEAQQQFPFSAQVKVRYRVEPTRAMITKEADGFKVKFEKAQRAISSGQSAVFYDKDKVIGGGIII